MYSRISDSINVFINFTWGTLKVSAKFIEKIPSYFTLTADYSKEDLLRLQREEEKFVLTELYARARDSFSNITRLQTPVSPFFASWTRDTIPSNIYVIAGSVNNARQVANYGESNHDPKARIHFGFFKSLMGRSNFTHGLLDTEEAKMEKGTLKDHMLNTKNLSYGRKIAIRRTRELLEGWNEDVAYLDQITYLGANIMGEAVIGIPELGLQHARQLRDIGKSLSEFYKKPNTVKPYVKFIAKLNKEIVTDQADAILAADRFAKKDFDQHANPENSATVELLKRYPASWYAAESALSAVLSMGIAQLNADVQIKQEMQNEVEEFIREHHLSSSDEICEKDLRAELPLMDSFYLETLRFSSTLSTLARKTSVSTAITITDQAGVKNQHTIPAESILLFPVRPRHFNEKFWEDPQTFNAKRFLLKADDSEEQRAKILKNRSELIPFSVGSRSCPSQYGFTEVVFKSVMMESLKYKITLDCEIETIPVWSPMPHLETDYLASVTRELPMNVSTRLNSNAR